MSHAFVFGARSRAALVGVHPDLVRVAELGLVHSPYDFAISEGVRSVERQRILVARGLSRTMESKHIDGRAIDVVAVGDLNGDGVVDWNDRVRRWDRAIYTSISLAMKLAADERGVKIRWGGEFKTFFDGPHFELA